MSEDDTSAMYGYFTEQEDGLQGLCAAFLPGVGWTPLAFTRPHLIERFRPHAQACADHTGKPVTLKKFTHSEILDTIEAREQPLMNRSDMPVRLFRIFNDQGTGRFAFATSAPNACDYATKLPDFLPGNSFGAGCKVLDLTDDHLAPDSPWASSTRKVIEANAIGLAAFALSADDDVEIGWHIVDPLTMQTTAIFPVDDAAAFRQAVQMPDHGAAVKMTRH